MTNGMIKSYSEMIQLKTFEERFQYLQLGGVVGKETFGYARYLNQILYNSYEWKHDVRSKVIIRDNGCDLACDGYEVHGRILIHHINPITVEDIRNRNPIIFDLENLVLVSHNTHEAIHYSNESLLITGPNIRIRNDTSPWRK